MRFSFSMRCRLMRLAVAILISFLFARGAGAHQEQETASLVDIWPQRTFLTVRVSGSGTDFLDISQGKIPSGAHDAAPKESRSAGLTETQRANAARYFQTHLMLKQGGVRLHGDLQRIEMVKTDAFDASQARFEAWYRFAREPELANQPLRVTSALFDFLENARTVVSLSGEIKIVPAGETAEFSPSLSTVSTSQNARDWALSGAAQLVSNPRFLIFTLALALAFSFAPPRVLAAALLAFAATNAVALSLAASGSLQLPLRIVESGTAFFITALAALVWWKARAGNLKPAASVALLVVLALTCGFLQGFAPVSALRQRGLPEEGLALCIAAFALAAFVAQALLLGAARPLLQRLQQRFEHNARYGGTDWPRALQFISGAIVLLGGFWTLERFFS